MNDFDLVVLEMVNDPELSASAIYKKTFAEEYDPAEGSVQQRVVSIPVRGIILDFTSNASGLYAKFGTEILSGDKNFLMQPPNKGDGTWPEIKIDPTIDTVQVGTTVYTVAAAREVNPTGTNPILYDLVLRK